MRLRHALLAMGLGLSSVGSPRSVAAFAWPSAAESLERILADGDSQARRAALDDLRALPRAMALPLLLRALDDDDLEVKREAATLAARLRYRAASEKVVPWLSDSDPRLRLTACELARAAPTEKAAPALGRVLADPDPKVRRAAAGALGELALAESVLPLVGRLDDSNAEVRAEVVRALARAGDRRAVLGLVAKLSDEAEEVRQASARALGELQDPKATAALLRALRDATPAVQTEAVKALGELQASEAAPELALLLEETPSPAVRRAAAEALGAVGSEAALSALLRALDTEAPEHVDSPVRKTLLSLGPRAEKPLLASLTAASSSPRLASGAALILAEMRAQGATDAILEAMRRGGISEEVGLRSLALSSDPKALPRALELLKYGKRPLRKQAIETISLLLDPRAADGRVVAPLTEALAQRGTSQEERLGLIHALGRSGSPKAVEVLAAFLGADEPRTRTEAIRALGALGPAGQDTLLLDALEDRHASVRMEAAIALGKTASEPTTNRLLDKLLSAAEVDRGALAIAVSSALARAEQEETAARAAGALQGADPKVRDALIEGLGRMKGRAAGEALEALVGSGSLADRRKVAEALAGHPEATSAWLALLDDVDATVRAAAVWALGTTPAPHVDSLSGFQQAASSAEDRDPDVATNAMATIARLALRDREAFAEPAARRLCAGLRHAYHHARANALTGLEQLGTRCADGSAERDALRWDPSEIVRAAAARLLRRVPSGDGSLDRRALARCVDEEPARRVAARCDSEDREAMARGAHPIVFFVVPDGGDEPAEGAPFAARFADGFVRSGVADRRGAVFEAAAPSGPLRLVPSDQ